MKKLTKNQEILSIYGASIQLYKDSRKKKIEEEINSYNKNSFGFTCKQQQKNGYIISVAYSVVKMKYGNVGIYRKEVFCFGTLETIYSEGNVIDLKHVKKITFKQVVNSAKNTLNYHLKNL